MSLNIGIPVNDEHWGADIFCNQLVDLQKIKKAATP